MGRADEQNARAAPVSGLRAVLDLASDRRREARSMNGMSQEEWDSRSDAGEDPYALAAEDFKRQDYIYDAARGHYLSPDQQQTLRLAGLLKEAVYWAKQPSP